MYTGTDDFQMVYTNIMGVFKNAGISSVIKEDLDDAIDHGVMVMKTVRLLCEALELSDGFKQSILLAAGLHDVGKLQLSHVLYGRKKEALHVDEMRYMRMHAANGRDMLRGCGYPEGVLEAVYHHHENFDGSGYPDNLAGTKIPLSSRIIKVCDLFCALVSERPYRAAFEFDTAVEMMIEDSKDLDMGIFLEFLKIYHSEKFEEIRQYAEYANAKKHYLHGVESVVI